MAGKVGERGSSEKLQSQHFSFQKGEVQSVQPREKGNNGQGNYIERQQKALVTDMCFSMATNHGLILQRGAVYILLFQSPLVLSKNSLSAF